MLPQSHYANPLGSVGGGEVPKCLHFISQHIDSKEKGAQRYLYNIRPKKEGCPFFINNINDVLLTMPYLCLFKVITNTV
jgi:hypothetical protein